MLEIRNLHLSYGKLVVLRGISLHVAPGEIVCLLGSNGAGKTSLLLTIMGLNRPLKGQILFEGEDITGASPQYLVRKGVALVPEGRQIFYPLTVEENLELGAYHRWRQEGRRAVQADLERVYALFPRLKERRRQKAGTLSGGEQQMLALARAFMARPRLLLLDEPSLGLAPKIVDLIMRTIVRLNQEGLTVLLVEQNARKALEIAHRAYVLETGRIVLEGPARELLHDEEVKRAYLGKDYREFTA
ncbi:ABC transporter ATP-binding protein [Thermosulfurimonas marina]|uniref:ABC transporter ATP-binding protein n=1 Tax=Thermosulfurimonas marina TaxID=2047767 RepID=A0A6H1WRD0_9BACT|nr:ABC transporter ATP-binding protein [Thermosulfurimonas marina]QJA05696.1 ABC transporter ATP-binding protein [Thermosulfurimonas marina]